MTVRNRILAAFATRMGAAWGDVGAPSENLPLSAIIPGEDTFERAAYGITAVEMEVQVERYAKLVNHAGVEAETLIGWLVRTATGTDTTLSGLCESIHPVRAGPLYPDEDSVIVGAYGVFAIRYKTLAGDPNTSPDT